MAELIAVRVRECPDGTHPNGDSVWLTPTLSLAGGIRAQLQLDAVNDRVAADPETHGAEAERLTGEWFETFVRHGAVEWDLHDEDGPIWAFDVERLVADYTLGLPVANVANDLYSGGLLNPLPAGRPRKSPSGPTAGSTSKKRTRRSPASSSRRDGAGVPLQALTP